MRWLRPSRRPWLGLPLLPPRMRGASCCPIPCYVLLVLSAMSSWTSWCAGGPSSPLWQWLDGGPLTLLLRRNHSPYYRYDEDADADADADEVRVPWAVVVLSLDRLQPILILWMSLWALLFLLFVVVVGSCCFVCLALATESWRGGFYCWFPARCVSVCLWGSSLRISSSGCTDFLFASGLVPLSPSCMIALAVALATVQFSMRRERFFHWLPLCVYSSVFTSRFYS